MRSDLSVQAGSLCFYEAEFVKTRCEKCFLFISG